MSSDEKSTEQLPGLGSDIPEYLAQRKEFFQAKERKVLPFKLLLILSIAGVFALIYAQHNETPSLTVFLPYLFFSWVLLRTSGHGDNADVADRNWIVFSRLGAGAKPNMVQTTPGCRVFASWVLLSYILISSLIFLITYRENKIRSFQEGCVREAGGWHYSELTKRIEDCMRSKGIPDYSFDKDYIFN